VILDSDYQLALRPKNTEERSEQTLSTLSILRYDSSTFRKEVNFFKQNYQEPDFFDILENISELQNLIDNFINKLKIQLGDLDGILHWTLSDSSDYSFKENKVQINSDEEGISLMLQRLTNLIEANRKAILEAEELEEFYVESLLLEFEKELEKSKWIFYLFSKY
jgi:DNA-binding ferritin-like protein